MRFVALLLTLLMLTACTGPGAKQKTAPAEPVTLRFFTHPNDRTFDLAIEAFERARGDIRIEKVTYSLSPDGTTPLDQIKMDRLRSREVDMLWVWAGPDQTQLVAADLLLPLEPLIQKDRLDLAPYGGLIEGLRLDGKLYVLPIHATPLVLWYNASIFAQAGLPVPRPGWTWEEFRQAAAKPTRGEGESQVWGVYAPSDLQQLAEAMVWQRATLVPIDPTAAREILSFWSTMIDTDRSVSPFTPPQSGQGASLMPRAQGRVAISLGSMHEYEGIYSPVEFPRPDGVPAPRWEAAPLPVFPGGQPVMSAFPTSLAIAKDSPHAEAAWEFLRFLASEEGAVAIVRAGRFPILRSPAVRDAWFERTPKPPRSTEFVFDLDFMAQSFVPGDKVFLVNGAFQAALVKVLQGGADWEALYKEFLGKRESILKEG